MNIKFWEKWTKKKRRGTRANVIAREANRIVLLSGTIYTNIEDAILINYEFIDNTGHSFICHQDDYAYKDFDGVPTYIHNVGDIFCCNCRFDGQIGSEMFRSILDANIGTQMIESLEDFRKEGTNWKPIIIGVGVLILALILWKSGILASLIQSITGTVQPVPTTPVPTTPIPTTPPPPELPLG